MHDRTEMSRSSRPEVFCKKGVLRNFAKFTEKHLCQSLFFNKVARLFLQNTSGGCFSMSRKEYKKQRNICGNLIEKSQKKKKHFANLDLN